MAWHERKWEHGAGLLAYLTRSYWIAPLSEQELEARRVREEEAARLAAIRQAEQEREREAAAEEALASLLALARAEGWDDLVVALQDPFVG